MGCPCRNNNKKSNEAFDVYANGGTDLVPLGLKDTTHLPMRFPQAFNNLDIIVLESRKLPPVGGTITLYGRNGNVEKRHRDALVENWPGFFQGAELELA